MSIFPVTPQSKRLIRTSNPTPPESEKPGKKLRQEMSDSEHMDTQTLQASQTLDAIQNRYAISDVDIQKIASTVKTSILSDINHLVELKTKPLVNTIAKLQNENKKLREDLDSLEQYGRRSLIRISGIPETESEIDTTPIVQKLLSEIDPDFKPQEIIRSHRVGKQKQNETRSGHAKPRQIIVRLPEPNTKFRLFKCRKNLKHSREFRSVYLNEDLTLLRSKLLYHARKLYKNEKIQHLWTTNGKILMKDNNGTLYDTSTIDSFVATAMNLDPNFVIPEEFM